MKMKFSSNCMKVCKGYLPYHKSFYTDWPDLMHLWFCGCVFDLGGSLAPDPCHVLRFVIVNIDMLMRQIYDKAHHVVEGLARDDADGSLRTSPYNYD